MPRSTTDPHCGPTADPRGGHCEWRVESAWVPYGKHGKE